MEKIYDPSTYVIEKEPYYVAVGNEITLFEAAYENHLPLLLKGPTGCGKTRFMEYMAWRLQRPMITVSCHDDLMTSDLVGRYLVKQGETVWVDGPLTRAVRCGGICYLDEIVEARKDTMVVIHPLADDRRIMPIDKLGQLLEVAWRDPYMPEFMASMPLLGEDGTLAKRFKNDDLQGRSHMKTGTLNDATAIAGYMITRSGKRLVIVLQHNGREAQSSGRRLQDAILKWAFEQ